MVRVVPIYALATIRCGLVNNAEDMASVEFVWGVEVIRRATVGGKEGGD